MYIQAKGFFLVAMMAILPLGMNAQRIQQKLGRGVVVANNGSNVTVTWRRLAQEPEDATYNVYVNGVKAMNTPHTYWKTTSGKVPVGAKVTVSLVTSAGEELAQSVPFEVKSFDMRNIFVDINFQKGGSPLSSADFNTAYVWPIDLDGDGEMDYVVNRKSNANGLDCYVEGYLRTGEHLWTVKLGPNELSCAGQDDMITVADMDCDGRGDVVIQSSDGTQFWDAETKGFGLYVGGKTTGDTDGDGIIDYETQSSRNAPRYISVIDGMTGCEKASIEQSYNQHYNRTNRASLMGDEYNKHVGHMGVCYLDGIHPAVVMEWHMRGSGGDHHYYNLGVAYDFSSGQAGKLREFFNSPTGGPAFHQIRVGDVDGDGCDEMIVGSYTMDHTGNTLFSANIAHGDRFRTSDIDPERPGLETFAIQQYAGDMLGQILYDARTGEPIKKWYLSASGDIGRGECIDIDRNHLGWEMWSTMNGRVYDAQGNEIQGYDNQYPCEGIWWDNELDREVVQTSDSHYNVYVQDFFKGREVEFAKISGYRYVTVYAKRAAFWGDIIGDWREELILLHKENGVIVGITGVTTDYASDNDFIYCLQEDPHYRGDCSTKGYYQSPNPGFYLGFDMPRPQLPPTMVTDLRYKAGTVASGSTAFTTFDQKSTAEYADGKTIMFDISGDCTQPVNIVGDIQPAATYFMNPVGHDYFLKGNIAGNGDIIKSQQGKVVIGDNLLSTGRVLISEGTLDVVGKVAGPIDLRARGTLAGNAVLMDTITFEGALNYEGCRLMPGSSMISKKSMVLPGNVYLEISERGTNYLTVEGNLTFKGTNYITIGFEDKTEGECLLARCTGTLTCDVSKLKVRGLEGVNYDLAVRDNQSLVLVINATRSPQSNVIWTGTESTTWDFKTNNFNVNDVPTSFVPGDEVVFPEEATRRSVSIPQMMPTAGVRFTHDTGTYTLNGEGGLSGTGNFVVDGKGAVMLNTTKNDFTGKAILNNGKVTVKNLEMVGEPSCLGAGNAIEMGKTTLVVSNNNTATDRTITLNDTATIQVPNGVTALKGVVKGTGTLVKSGAGQLTLTYDGANPYKSTILQAGTLAMGTWRSTFGTATSSISVTGNSTITIFDNNSTGSVPTLNNAITVNKGKTLTINGGQRCNVQGKWLGEGTVKIKFPYVRGDVSTNMSQFEGTVEVTGGQFRLTAAIDLSKGTLQPDAGVYVVGVKGGSGTEQSFTHKLGALSSTATDCSFGTGIWNVGYLNTNTTFAGIFNGAATLNKYGDGTLSLTGQSTGKANVNAGTLSLTGQMASVVVNKGGTLAAVKSTTAVGTATVTGTLQVKAGGQLLVRGRSTAASVDQFNISGKITLASPVFLMQRLNGEWQPNVDYRIFTGSGSITLTGTPTFEPAIPAPGYKWDYSQLASDGILRVVEDPDGILSIDNEHCTMDNEIYDLSGRKIVDSRLPNHKLPKGLYIKEGKKVLVK